MPRYVSATRKRRFSYGTGKAPGQFYEDIDEAELIRDAIDVHIHAGPGAMPRRLDGIRSPLARMNGV